MNTAMSLAALDMEGRVWDGPPRIGTDRGTAGIAFSAEPPNPGGGQQARNLQVAIRP